MHSPFGAARQTLHVRSVVKLFLLPAPSPWPYIADFTRPEGHIWYGIAVLPCFSASGKVPVTRCGLPLRGTYAVYCPQPPAPKGGLSREEETDEKAEA
nr:MAG TPA: hypothetical protein [Caudoviricetes sp.]